MTPPSEPQDIAPADARLLHRALALAENGLYTTAPNPRVGCVICRGGRVIAEGWHRRAGEAHAEVIALRQINNDAAGADVYVSLEPCAHEGRTPPCADALAAAKPARVIIAMQDPNPQVAGAGIRRLRAAGIAVSIADKAHAVARRALELNIGFVTRMTKNRPWTRLKIAATMDGKTALDSGLSRWISNEESRVDAHHYRARSCAVLTGVGTALQDNPRLSVRHVPRARPPLRVLVDSSWRASPDMALFADDNIVVAAACAAPADAPAETWTLAQNGKVDLPALMRRLAAREINEVTVEAGRKLNGALLSAGLVDEIVLYIAPRAFGDSGRDMLSLPPPPAPADAPAFRLISARALGDDVRIIYRCDAADKNN